MIGGPSPGNKLAKAQTIIRRVASLRQWAADRRPDVALSHNSYAQIVAARSLRVPAVTAMDFEHQPANHLAFRLANVIVTPEVIPLRVLERKGAVARKLIRYPGLKEQLYLGDFEPDRAVLTRLGLRSRPQILVVVRTPPTRAVYHPSSNPVFMDALRTICGQKEVLCVALTRHPEQTALIERLGLENCIVPSSAIDARSLIFAADLMVGAGGTMTREAALMGIPTWTAFAGATPAVDRWLEDQGLLRRLSDPAELGRLEPRRNAPRTPAELRAKAVGIERVVIDAICAAAGKAAARTLRAESI